MPTPGEGVKVGFHHVGPVVDPDQRTFRPVPEFAAGSARLRRRVVPGARPRFGRADQLHVHVDGFRGFRARSAGPHRRRRGLRATASSSRRRSDRFSPTSPPTAPPEPPRPSGCPDPPMPGPARSQSSQIRANHAGFRTDAASTAHICEICEPGSPPRPASQPDRCSRAATARRIVRSTRAQSWITCAWLNLSTVYPRSRSSASCARSLVRCALDEWNS